MATRPTADEVRLAREGVEALEVEAATRGAAGLDLYERAALDRVLAWAEAEPEPSGMLSPQSAVLVCQPQRAGDQHLTPVVGRQGTVLSMSGTIGARVYTCRVLVDGSVLEIPSDMLVATVPCAVCEHSKWSHASGTGPCTECSCHRYQDGREH